MTEDGNKGKRKAKRRGRGEGTVYQRQDKLWVGQAVIGYDPITGKPNRKTVYGKTRQDVVQKLTKISVLVNEGKYADSNMTVQEWLSIWLNEYAKNTLRPKTYESYAMFIRLHIVPHVGSVRLRDLTTDRIQKLYNYKARSGRMDGKGGLAPRSVERIHTVLHKALEQAVITRKIGYNPAHGATLPLRIQREIRSLTPQEQDIFEAALEGERLLVAFLLGLWAGLRRGETLGLQWDDFDFDQSWVKIQRSLQRIKDKDTGESKLRLDLLKSKKSYRTVPLPEVFMGLLLQHKINQDKEKEKAGPMYQDQNLVFCTSLGGFIEPRNYNRIFSRIRDKAGIENFNLHGLRHTYATRLYEIGVDPKIRQELMGHEKSSTTDGYTHVMLEMMKKATDNLNKYVLDRKKPPQIEED